LQNHLKLVPAFDQTLAQVAAQTRARIGFFIRDALVGRLFRARIESVFTQWGLDPGQSLAFFPPQSYESYLGAIASSTLVLDSPCFSGGATSLDALGAGALVLTHQSETARGRQTAGMLQMMEIDGLTAKNENEYIARAVDLVEDAAARGALRARIVERNSALFEHQDVVMALAEFLQRAVAKAAAD
jgi:predicted O-linked N-acetylglucosamine transferase (SPINDLY family)